MLGTIHSNDIDTKIQGIENKMVNMNIDFIDTYNAFEVKKNENVVL